MDDFALILIKKNKIKYSIHQGFWTLVVLHVHCKLCLTFSNPKIYLGFWILVVRSEHGPLLLLPPGQGVVVQEKGTRQGSNSCFQGGEV